MDEQNFWAAQQEATEQQARAAEVRQAEPPAEPPIEDSMTRWRREARESDRREARARAARVRAEAATSAAPDWREYIAAEIAAERAFLIEVVGTAVGELRAELEQTAQKQLDDQLRPLRCELAELRIANAELRITIAKLREHAISSPGVADVASSARGRVN